MKKFSLIATILAASAGLLFSQNKLVDDPMPQDMKDKIAKACPVKPAASPKKPRKILSFSRTVGWRHNTGILGANEMLSNLSKNLGIFEVVFSDDPAEFEAENLKKYDAVILNNTTQAFLAPSSDPKNPKSVNLKDPEVKAISDRRCQNLIDFVNNGGGVFAIHAGVDCYNYPHNRNKAFTDMLGGEFISHPWGAGNIAETFVIDDTQSPVTKGIWKNDGFKLKDEIYMVGESYDRSKCRVLIRLDEFRSPIPSAFGDGTYPKKPRKVRTDGDIAMVWIKSFGKGRVAYGAWGHGWDNYPRPEIQELYMRLIQFVCGDLDADTTPLPFTNKSVYVPMYDQPTLEQIKEFSSLSYGEKDEQINNLLYALYANNTDKEYCKKIESFVYDELKSDSGSAVYRAILAEALRAVGISSDANCVKFQKVLERLSKAKDYDTRGICGRLSNAIDHYTTKTVNLKTKDKPYQIPSALPKNALDQTRLMRFLAVNKEAKIPSYLTFEALDEKGKAKLLYTLWLRGEDASAALKIKPQSADLLIAQAFLVSKIGKLSDMDTIIESAELLNGNQKKVVSAFLASLKDKGIVKHLLDKSMKKNSPAQADLIAQTLGRLDISDEMNEIYAAYPNMDESQKKAMLEMMASIATKDVFINLLKIYEKSEAHPLFGQESRVLFRCLSNNPMDAEMFEAALSAAKKAKDPKEIAVFMRFMPMLSTSDGIDFCIEQYKAGNKEAVVKTLGDWKNASALKPLLQICKSLRNQRALTLAQISLVNVGKRAGFDAESAEYILNKAVRAEEKEIAIEAMQAKPSPQIVDLLKKKGLNKEAAKAAEVLKNLKPTFDCSWSASPREKKFAVDGNPKTYCCTNAFFSKGTWIQVDFGYPRKISKIVYRLGKVFDFPRDYQLFAGASAESLAPVPSKLEISRDGWTATLTLEKPVVANILKVECTKDTKRHWTIGEVEVSQ